MSAPNDASSLTLQRKQRTLFVDRTRKETAFRNGLQIFVDLEHNSLQQGAITYTPNYYNTTTGALVTTPAERDAYIASVPTRVSGTPTITNVVRGNASVTVYFTPSSQPVVSPVTGYRVISTPEGITAFGTSSPITVTGLTNGTTYTFRIVAINANGSSAPSVPSDPVTPATFPSALDEISVESGDGIITVTRVIPGYNGGLEITDYKVTVLEGELLVAQRTFLNVPYTFTGLTNGTTYTLGATAINEEGESPPIFITATPATVPSAPEAIEAVAGDGTITVTITPSIDDGGSPIYYYVVSSDPFNGQEYQIDPSVPTTELSGFANGTTYRLAVASRNAKGDSQIIYSAFVTPENPLPSGNIYTSPTSNSSVLLSTQSPFAGGYSYEFTSPSYLSISGDNSWALGTRDFTIEWFQYQTDSNSFPRIFAIGQYPSTSFGCSIEGGTFYGWFSGAKDFGNAGIPDNYKNTWIHFAFVRRNGILRAYKNGTQLGPEYNDTSNITNNITTLYIGAEVAAADPGTQFTGFMTNIRIVKGLAVYTGDFTIPTSNLTLTAPANPYGGSNTVAIPDQYTKLLLVPGPTVQSFTTVGTTSWTAPAGVTSVEYLVVGGGGGGGGAAGTGSGGGGGGGAVLTGTRSVTPGSTYTITVGGGGTAGTNTSTDGGDGAASSFDTIIAGGGGRGFNRSAVNETGISCKGGAAQSGIIPPTGGSGGGTRENNEDPINKIGFGAGGGGGAGGPGQDGFDSTPGENVPVNANGGPGGVGISSSISGSAFIYGAGGKGGNESLTAVNGAPGAANTGNGGEGGMASSWGGSGPGRGAEGGIGGSGIVILKY